MFDVSRELATSPDVAFDAMADARNEVHWNSKVSRADLMSGEPVRRGSRFQTVNHGQTFNATITEYLRPSRVTFEVTGRHLDITSTFTFSSSSAGTLLRGKLVSRPKGILKVLFPLIRPVIGSDFPKQVGSFAAYCCAPE